MTTPETAASAFAADLDQAPIDATILSTEMRRHGTVLEVELRVPDVADWDLRYAVLAVAERTEDEHGLPLICFFREAP